MMYSPKIWVILSALLLLYVSHPLAKHTGISHSAAADSGHLLENPDFIKDVQQAIGYVYNQEFERSREILSPWLENEKAQPLAAFWEGLPLWWDILADLETDKHDTEFIRVMESADRASDLVLRRDRRNLDALVIKSLSNGFLARLHANRGSWYKSLTHGRQAINILFNIEQIYPDVPDIQFGLGLYNYFSAHLNEQYRVVRAVSWMIPKGDKKEGLERLKVAAEESAYMIPEASYFLGHIYLNYEKDMDLAEAYLTDLIDKYPQNPFFNRLMLRNYYQQREYNKAIKLNDVLIDRFEDDGHLPTLEELYTMRGMLHYRRIQYTEAEAYFLQVLSYSDQLDLGDKRQHQLLARYQLGRLYMRTGKPDMADAQFRHITQLKVDSPIQDRARRMIRK